MAGKTAMVLVGALALAGCEKFSEITGAAGGGAKDSVVKVVRLVCKLPAAARDGAREQIRAVLEPEGMSFRVTCTPEEAEEQAAEEAGVAPDPAETAAEVVQEAEEQAAEAVEAVEEQTETEAAEAEAAEAEHTDEIDPLNTVIDEVADTVKEATQ